MQNTVTIPEQPASARLWPETPRTQLRAPDPFPGRLFLLGILPGLLGAIVLLGVAFYLEQRANRGILYLTQQGALATVRADGSGTRSLAFAGLADYRAGPAHWAPDGSRFTAAVSQEGTAKVLISRPGDTTPPLIFGGGDSDLSLPSRPWSDDGAYLALIRSHSNGRNELLIGDVQQSRAVTVSLVLDSSSQIIWRPHSHDLLVSARTNGITPTLQVAAVDGHAQPFAPPDQQVSRGDGAWSPDGQRVAYVAGSDTSNVTGGIWLAGADGASPQQIVRDGLNLAPVWSPAGDLLFFTRYLTQTNEFALYRIRPDGQQLARVGSSTPAWRVPGIDRSALLAWSPDGSQLFFQGVDQQQATVSAALADGSNPRVVYTESGADQGALVARWAPTSRALIIASPSRGMLLRWVDQDRPAKSLASGAYPAVQP